MKCWKKKQGGVGICSYLTRFGVLQLCKLAEMALCRPYYVIISVRHDRHYVSFLVGVENFDKVQEKGHGLGTE